MKVITIQPNALDKNLGRAYNEAMSLIGEDDWCCIRDLDTLLLTPDGGNILHEYAVQNEGAGILTCFTNRISPLSKNQLLNESVNEESDIRRHIKIAEKQKKYLYNTSPIERDISGFLMMISKRTWNDFKFSEDFKCLGVDTEFNRRIRTAGRTILRMDGLYVWHTYRLMNGITYKAHLV